jgi:hypothetical protein
MSSPAVVWRAVERFGRRAVDRRCIELDQWAYYTRELQLPEYIMSGTTVGELAATVARINARHASRPRFRYPGALATAVLACDPMIPSRVMCAQR